MNTNPIASRIADFLKKHPPFKYLTDDELNKLSSNTIVKYYQAEEYVFKQGDENQPYLFVVQEGEVCLERNESENNQLVDICDEGEVFGVRAMITSRPYVFNARCAQETLIYALPLDLFKIYLEQNNKITLFFASGLAAGDATNVSEIKTNFDVESTDTIINWNRKLSKPSKEIIFVLPDKPIKEVATLMTKEKIGSILVVDELNNPIGIVTDTDFRTKVGIGSVDIEKPISEMMTKGVISMPLGLSLSNYLLKMLQNEVRHIALTNNQKTVGMLSEHDLLSSHQNHPFTLAFAIKNSYDVHELVKLRNDADELVKYYLTYDVSVDLVSLLISNINDALINQFIKIALNEMGRPSTKFCWLSLGSEGREEQLIRTDQDNALMFADVDDASQQFTQQYFIELSKKVNTYLNLAKFEFCPAEMMASNPKWCQPLSQWKKYFSGWITNPQEMSLMLSTIFFDFRKIYGDDELVKQLQDHLNAEVQKKGIFLNFLGANAMKNPAPLSFFKNFMVERSGEHKNRFDIKGRAMMPLIDIARLLVMSYGYLEKNNTADRYRWLAEKEPNNKSLYIQAADSFEYLMKFRALNGFNNNAENKRYIDIEKLARMDRLILRNTFDPINELQELVKVRFRLNYFR